MARRGARSRETRLNGWMDGWMDGMGWDGMDGWMDGWLDEWMEVKIQRRPGHVEVAR